MLENAHQTDILEFHNIAHKYQTTAFIDVIRHMGFNTLQELLIQTQPEVRQTYAAPWLQEAFFKKLMKSLK